MPTKKRRKNARRQRAIRTFLLFAVTVALTVLLIVGSLQVWDKNTGSVSSDPGTESVPTGTVTTSSIYTPATTTTTTTSGTTTTTTGKKTSPTLLQYGTEGRYVQPAGAVWNLLLVNDWNKLPDGYDQAVTFVAGGRRNQKVDARILESLNAMLQAGSAYGIDVQSGYRSSDHQATLYWRQVNNYLSWGYDEIAAQQQAGAIVKRPGHSEHNCGLAVDLGGSGNFKLETDFENTAAFRWLIENCAEYGFILRFPKGKENITGVIYEPWHYRYVGVEAAKYIMENGLCLEEYLEQTGQ